MSRAIDELDPVIREKARALIAELIVEDIPHALLETRRSQLVQLAYWLQGRAEVSTIARVREAAGLPGISEAEAKRKITQLDGVQNRSKHQDGRALDIIPTDSSGNPAWNDAMSYKEIGRIARGMGFVCGQDWLPLDKRTGLGWDPPHYEV